ncbi:MAG: sialidase family protein [Cytophagales bacterium]|nr:sialidase family protein [Cytophagales bacterium]
MKQIISLSFVLASLVSAAQFRNVKIADEADGRRPGDPSVIVNHRNPKNIIAAADNDRVMYTLDGGESWTEITLTSPLGVAGNSSMIIDAKGKIYTIHRSDSEGKGKGSQGWLDRLVCQRSEDFGKTWNEGSSLGASSTIKSDKQAIAVNAKKQILYATWTQSDQYFSQDPACQSYIAFSSATNAGNRWDKPVTISQTPGDCSNSGTSAAGATPAVGVDGRIYVTWSNQGVIYFDRSYDEGKTWLSNDLAIAKQEGGWALQIPGFGTTQNTPILMIDNSPGRYHGMLFLTYADQRNGADDTDIWVHRSPRGGDSWTAPMRVNSDEPGKHQFCPSVAVDQTNGLLYVLYLDRRAHDDVQTDVYLAYSTDSGSSFKEVKISETPFDASETEFFEFTGISAHNGTIAAVWTRTDNGKVSVWASIIREAQLRALK